MQRLRRVRSVERAISIGILRILLRGARGASFRIRFAQHDGSAAPFRKRLDDLKSLLDRGELPVDAHLDVIALPFRRALRMKAYEIEWRAGGSSHEIIFVGAVSEEL